MVYTTRAIVLKVVKHGDHTVVLKAFTELHGLRSFLVRPGGKGGVSRAALQALNRVELVVNEHADRDLHAVREFRLDRPYRNVPFDAVRGALALFVQEVLYKVLRGEAADAQLFLFIEHALEAMDSGPDVSNFPMVFLLRLSGELGFLPAPPAQGEDRFDLKEGEFTQGSTPHGHTLGPPLSGYLAELLNEDLGALPRVSIPTVHRRALLDHLLLYYRMHIEGLGELRSPAVLHQTLG